MSDSYTPILMETKNIYNRRPTATDNTCVVSLLCIPYAEGVL